eukprot:scaffold5828_cov168-Amphora_coffeaeformis.AAC.14
MAPRTQVEQQEEDEVGVGCGCFGRRGGGRSNKSSSRSAPAPSPPPLKSALKPSKKFLPKPASNEIGKEPEQRNNEDTRTVEHVPPRRASMGETLRRTSIYFEAQDGIIEEASLEFFDAVQELDDDTNNDVAETAAEEAEEVYPIITRALPPSQSFRVSIHEPETMLRNKRRMAMDVLATDTASDDDEFPPPLVPASSKSLPTGSLEDSDRLPARGQLVDAKMQMSFARRGSVEVNKDLREPTVVVEERGYPGLLDEHELRECQAFYRAVTERKGAIRDIVFAYKDVEDEPYTICRFLRPTKFSSADMLARLEENKATWEKAAKAKFYPDLEKAMGIPTSLFLRFYPFFYQGNAKNGCPVNYFKAGKIHVEGLLSILTMEKISFNAWNVCKHVFPQMLKKAKDKNPNFVRCESINVLDLEGLTSAQASSEAMEIIKTSAKVADFFPETMHCMLILNAPTWFSVTWRLIRSFIDPRTARKIEVYTSTARGQHRLQQLIKLTEIPHDFGGVGPPTDATDGPNREALQVLHVSKKSRTQQDVPCLADVARDETITALRIYSRSATGVLLDVNKDDQPVVKSLSIDPPKKPPSGTSLNPYFRNLINGPIVGPCRISLRARAQPNEKKPTSKSSHGYFVVVAFITKK